MSKQRPLPERLTALKQAAHLARGRSADEVVDHAEQVAARADGRLAFSGGHTVVALAGATGSGKSSAFNAITGAEIAEPGVRRPTTSKALAATFGPAPSSELLDWLDVPRRQVVAEVPKGLDGLVLLDLPDHDSTQTQHRVEADRLVELVDMLVWVVDPQKYADAALHDHYLKPMRHHAATMLVLLNQVDTLAPQQADDLLADLRRLLEAEGLGATRVIGVSALTGQGFDEVRQVLAKVVKDKSAAAQRLGHDVTAAAGQLEDSLGKPATEAVGAGTRKQLVASLSKAAGTDVVAEATLNATRRRGSVITGWPALSWLASLRPDPLRRLRLGALPKANKKQELEPAKVQRTNITRAEGALQARVDSAIREVSDEASAGLPRGWADAVRTASRTHQTVLADDLDQAVATTDLGMGRGFGYWRLIQVIQWILMAAVIVGLGWLLVDFVLAYFQLPLLPSREWRGVPVPTLLVFGGVGAGLLLGLVSRLLVEVTARAKGRKAQSALGRSISRVAEQKVIAPVNAELARHQQAREQVRLAA
ncbi:GTPase [Propionibacteriaceae bacterium Y1923]